MPDAYWPGEAQLDTLDYITISLYPLEYIAWNMANTDQTCNQPLRYVERVSFMHLPAVLH